MMRISLLLAALALAACAERFSPDEYAQRAVQQANPVQPGVVLGSRRVGLAADGAAGTAAGAAAGGAVGGAAGGAGVTAALGAVGGALIGGIIGRTAERSTANTDAIEYIIRQDDGALVSVTQRDAAPIANGTRVLVIKGAQARIVADYTAPVAATRPAAAPAPATEAPPTAQVPPAAQAPPAPVVTLPIAAVAPPPVVPPPPRPADELTPVAGR
jgi:outer membrane lipoprotein SlyB